MPVAIPLGNDGTTMPGVRVVQPGKMDAIQARNQNTQTRQHEGKASKSTCYYVIHVHVNDKLNTCFLGLRETMNAGCFGIMTPAISPE